tara:strand:- start:1422 stop:1802 length:381 start_codon:yes stop_codon:yes gene_type:complete
MNPHRKKFTYHKKYDVSDPEQWKELATNTHNDIYTFDPLTSEERKRYRALKLLVEQNIPEKYSEGVFDLNRHTRNCGEPMFIVDGRADYVLWMNHRTCKAPLLSRNKELWCTSCNTYIKREEVANA